MNAQSIPGDFVYSSAITQDVDAPVRMAVDNQDNMFVVDATGNKLKVFSPAGILVDSLMFTSSPSSVAVGDNNELFVGLGAEGRIYRKSSGGALTEIYSGLIVPSDMTAGPDNLLYIVDSRNKRVLVIDFFGNFVRYIGSGVFYAPIGIAYDRKNSRIIVSEHGGTGNGFNLHSEIRVFSLTGTLLNTFGGYGNGNGKFYRTQGITVGRCGRIYVVDPYQGNISLFDENGTYITKFGTFGSSPDQMDIPMDVAFNSAEQVIVSVMNNGSLEFYNITDALPSSTIVTSSKYVCPGNSASILVSFTGTAPWTYTYVRNGQEPVTAVSYYSYDTIVVTQTGIYTIIALSDATTAGTCFTGAATILQNPLPTASILSVDISICQGDSANISVALTGMPPWTLTYAIDGIEHATVNNILQTTFNIHTALPGTYTLTAVSGGICSGNILGGSSTIEVNPLPLPLITNNSPVCEGGLLSLACNTP
jgi:hypothetical protein